MFDLPERITYWVRSGNDGLGGYGWLPPVVSPARIAYKQDKFTDINGDDSVSTAVAYTEGPISNADIRNGVWVYFGESAAVSPPPEAEDIRAISQTPSGSGALKKLWFG